MNSLVRALLRYEWVRQESQTLLNLSSDATLVTSYAQNARLAFLKVALAPTEAGSPATIPPMLSRTVRLGLLYKVDNPLAAYVEIFFADQTFVKITKGESAEVPTSFGWSQDRCHRSLAFERFRSG